MMNAFQNLIQQLCVHKLRRHAEEGQGRSSNLPFEGSGVRIPLVRLGGLVHGTKIFQPIEHRHKIAKSIKVKR